MAASAARRRSSLTLSSSSRRTAPSSSSSSCSSNEARRHREIFIRGHLEEDEGELLTDLMAGYKRVIPTGRSASSSRRRTTAAAGAPRGSTPETLEWNSSAVTLPIEFNDIDEDDNDDCIGDSYGAEQNMATTTTAAVTQRHDEDDDALESLLVLNGKKVSGLRHQQHVQHEAEMFVVNDVERSVDTPLALRLSQGGEHIAEEQPDSLGSFVLPLGRSASFSRRGPYGLHITALLSPR
ncbi:Hypothetical protein, putative [Bodo saltans]|uniref:Uncharacterized protein n=1 Tax=Bodo saltans TaxID=75058 RepID=A0A0S4J1G7_BODSA|nr:Hypothetical protein, putative [Bodo saltans]|eukprot:CUG03763.1 Hypothetical protein, putative [Bodo saltans]